MSAVAAPIGRTRIQVGRASFAARFGTCPLVLGGVEMPEKTSLTKLERLKLDDFSIDVESPSRVKISGSIATRDPDPAIASHIRRLHAAAMEDGLKRVEVDIRDLSFVNSSGIRVFVDWALQARGADGNPAYRLRFLVRRKYTWQRMSLVALESLATDVIEVAED